MNEKKRPRILLVSIGMYGQKYLSELTQKDVGGDLVGVVDPAVDRKHRRRAVSGCRGSNSLKCRLPESRGNVSRWRESKTREKDW